MYYKSSIKTEFEDTDFLLGATSLVGALVEILDSANVSVELDIDTTKFTTYGVETAPDMQYTRIIRAPSMLDAEMYVSHVLKEWPTCISEWEEEIEPDDEVFVFSAAEMLVAFRD